MYHVVVHTSMLADSRPHCMVCSYVQLVVASVSLVRPLTGTIGASGRHQEEGKQKEDSKRGKE